MDEQRATQVLHETCPGSGERVLVAVMNDPRDLEIARSQGWYRIPVARAPRQVGADFVAFYLTGAFPPEQRFCVAFFAPIRAYRLARRIDLLPAEPHHLCAQEHYFKVEIGPLQPLPHPIPSRKLRRITFIPTTLQKLLSAQEINDLWDKGRHQDVLWAALKAQEVEAERQVEIEESGVSYLADFVIEGAAGRVIVLCEQTPLAGQDVLYLAQEQILQETDLCVQRIREAMLALGA